MGAIVPQPTAEFLALQAPYTAATQQFCELWLSIGCMSLLSPPLLPSVPGPRNAWSLFWAFSSIALQGFGGVMAIIQREVVQRRQWLSAEEFMQDWAVAQVMPGSNVVNLSMMIGQRFLGARGAMAAVAGMFLLPMLLMLAAGSAYAYWADNAIVSGALHGVAAVAAGMVLGAGCKLAHTLPTHPLPLWLCVGLAALGFVLMAWLQWPLLAVLLSVGSVGYALTWLKLSSHKAPSSNAPEE
jgi:chromate transporter